MQPNEPRTINEARTQANINARAARLWQDGYTWNLAEAFGGVYYEVRSPEGEYYGVDPTRGFTCTCPCYAERRVCKHSLAVKVLHTDREAQEVAALEEENRWWQEAGFTERPLHTF